MVQFIVLYYSNIDSYITKSLTLEDEGCIGSLSRASRRPPRCTGLLSRTSRRSIDPEHHATVAYHVYALRPSTYLITYLITCLVTYLPIYLSTYLPIYLSTYLPIYLSTSIYLSTCLKIYLSTYLPVHLSTRSPIYPSTYLPVICLLSAKHCANRLHAMCCASATSRRAPWPPKCAVQGSSSSHHAHPVSDTTFVRARILANLTVATAKLKKQGCHGPPRPSRSVVRDSRDGERARGEPQATTMINTTMQCNMCVYMCIYIYIYIYILREREIDIDRERERLSAQRIIFKAPPTPAVHDVVPADAREDIICRHVHTLIYTLCKP